MSLPASLIETAELGANILSGAEFQHNNMEQAKLCASVMNLG